nr:hypothetical protein [Tanacetum cinerariifolium]
MMIANKNGIIWLMASMGSSPFLNTRTVRPESSWGNSGCCDCWLNVEQIPIEGWMVVENKRHEVLMIDWLSIVETDKVIHTREIDIVKPVVEIESFVMSSNEFDKKTRTSDSYRYYYSVRVSLELIKEEDDVPLVDGVLNGALNAFGDIGLSFGDGLLKFRFEKMRWKCLRLKVNEEDDDLKMRIGNHFIKKK